MASRTIAVKITIDNRDAINSAKAQVIADKSLRDSLKATNDEIKRQENATRDLSSSHQSLSHVQAGLTNSFLKGNLAARGISMALNGAGDAVAYLLSGTAELQLTMARVSAITGMSAEATAGLQEQIFKLGRTSFASTNDIAKTSLELSKLGFEGQSLSATLSGVVQLSALLGDSLESTGELVGGVVTTFNLSNEEAAAVADKLFIATGKSIANIEGFKIAFSLAGNAAANAGISFEEFAAVVAALSNQGIRASTIGTGLRNFIGELSKEGSKAQRVLGGSIESMGLLGAMQKVAELNPKTGSLIEIFGKPGAPVAAGMKQVGDQYQEFLKAVQEGNGSLDAAGKKIDPTLLASLARLKNSLVETFSISSGPFLQGLTQIADAIAKAANKLSDFEKASQQLNSGTIFEKSGFLRLAKTALLPFSTFEAISNQMDKNATIQSYGIVDKYSTASMFSSALRKPEPQFNPSSLLQRREDPRVRQILDEKETEKAKKAAEREAKRREQEIKKTAEIWEKGQQHIFDLKEKARKEDEKKDKDAVKTWEEGMKAMSEAAFKHSETMKQWAFESSASVAYVKVGIDGLNGSIDLFSQYLVTAFSTGASNPWKGISDAFAGFARQMAAQLVALTLKLIAFKATLALLGVATGGGVTAGAGLFGFAGGNMFQQLLLTGLGGVGPKAQASGTDEIVRKPTLYMAGEAGPERVNITPKPGRSTRGGANSTAVVVNVYGDINDADQFVQKVNRANERIGRNFV